MMTDPLLQVIHSPVIAIALTLAAFLCAVWLYRRSGWLVLQPVLVTMLIIIGGIRLLGLDYQAYREAVVPISWLLGPATVALAVPLYRNVRRIRQALWPVMLTLLVGGVAIVALTLLFARWLGADVPVLMTLATKSVTMPIAMPLAEQLGGIAALAAVLVMLTGVAGTAMLPPLLNLCGVQHAAARGMAYGMNAHAVGTARALEEGDECGAFAALAMGALGALTAVLLPLAFLLWHLLLD